MRASPITPDLAARIVKNLNEENALICRIMLETGLRIGDVVALTVDKIRQNVLILKEQKTGHQRNFEISPPLLSSIRRHADRRKAASGGSRWLFPGHRDPAQHKTRQAVWSAIRAAAMRISPGVPISPHSFRKSYAVTIYHEAGYSLEALKAALGHQSGFTSLLYIMTPFKGTESPCGGNRCPRLKWEAPRSGTHERTCARQGTPERDTAQSNVPSAGSPRDQT